jgi:hypothetical protein
MCLIAVQSCLVLRSIPLVAVAASRQGKKRDCQLGLCAALGERQFRELLGLPRFRAAAYPPARSPVCARVVGPWSLPVGKAPGSDPAQLGLWPARGPGKRTVGAG